MEVSIFQHRSNTRSAQWLQQNFRRQLAASHHGICFQKVDPASVQHRRSGTDRFDADPVRRAGTAACSWKRSVVF
jgi:hypothetical protein